MDWLRRYSATLLLTLITLVGAFLRFYQIDAKTIWLDEAFSIWIARHNLPELWSWLIRIDHHPPLYYSLLYIWQFIFGDLQGAVRAFSALCSTLTIPIFYAATQRLFGRPAGLIAALILAVSPFHIRFAQEARMYALMALAAAAALYFFVHILMNAERRDLRLYWIGLAAAQAAVMLSHNTATIFFPLALNLAIGGALLWKYWQGGVSSWPALNDIAFERQWLRGQALALILWLPWSIPFVIQSTVVDHEFWIQPPTLDTVRMTLHNFNFVFLPNWIPLHLLWNLLYWALAGIGIYTLRHTPARTLLLLSLFVTPFVGELIVSLRRPIFYDRTLIWTTLPYYMLIALGIRHLERLFPFKATSKPQEGTTQSPHPNPPPAAEVGMVVQGSALPTNAEVALRRSGEGTVGGATMNHRWQVPPPSAGEGGKGGGGRAAQGIILALLLVFSGLSLSSYYVYFDKEGWDKATTYVAKNVQPDDVILFNATWVQLPFEYYFRHHQTGTALHGLPVDLFDRGVLEPKMTEADVPAMHNLLANHKRVWLVYSHDWYTDPNKIIPRELDRLMQRTDQREFIGLQVMRYEAK